MHREPDVGFDPGSPGSRPGPKAGAKLLRHPGIPNAMLSNKFAELGSYHHNPVLEHFHHPNKILHAWLHLTLVPIPKFRYH